ncbi:hypothetical protein, partial [Candidatus Ruminimicrobiellum ovillum]|uniref:hypothetical protein n=1 Tax=Candidatus Ruminimicrobiellum ovillum TaxID=1947927 RepID=UPI00355A9823
RILSPVRLPVPPSTHIHYTYLKKHIATNIEKLYIFFIKLSKNCGAIFILKFKAYSLCFSIKICEAKFSIILNVLKH